MKADQIKREKKIAHQSSKLQEIVDDIVKAQDQLVECDDPVVAVEAAKSIRALEDHYEFHSRLMGIMFTAFRQYDERQEAKKRKEKKKNVRRKK